MNGNITLTNGTFFGNIEGTVTEEHIDAESIVLRQHPNGASTPQGIILEDGFKILGYTGNQSSTNRIDIDCSTGVIKHGGIQQTTNTASNSFSSSVTFSATATHNGGVDINNNFSLTSRDNNTSSDPSGIRSVVINGDGVGLYPDNNSTERLRITRNGDIDFKSTIGSINGFSSSTPNDLTNTTPEICSNM